MSHHLRSCIHCERHIRISESVCPFCHGPVPDARRTPPPRGKPARRLSRAAALATMATVGAVGPIAELTACSSDGANGAPSADAAGAADTENMADVSPDIVTAVAAYGGNQVLDALPNEDADATPPNDAPDVLTAGDAYGLAQIDAHDSAPDVLTGGDAYGVSPRDGDPDGG